VIGYRLLMIVGALGLILASLSLAIVAAAALGPMFIAARLARRRGPRAELAAGALGLAIGLGLAALLVLS
jgi:hypothetical protein